MQNEKKCCAEIIKEAIEKWGNELQTVVCMEECSELIKECSKMLRGKGNKSHLIEEIADVKICLVMLEKMYEISAIDVNAVMLEKIERLKKRIEEENYAKA